MAGARIQDREAAGFQIAVVGVRPYQQDVERSRRHDDPPYFAASRFTVVTFRSVTEAPIVFSRRPPENSDSLDRVRQSQ